MSSFSMRCLTDSFRLTFNIFHRMLQNIKYINDINLWEVRIAFFKSIGSEFSGGFKDVNEMVSKKIDFRQFLLSDNIN